MKHRMFVLAAIASLSLTACGGGGKTTFVSPPPPPPPPPSTANEWTWVNGSNIVNQQGTYGTQGTPAPTNVPGARSSASTWTDASGNFWLFGGFGYGPAGDLGAFNDLWKYSGGAWTWVSGSNAPNGLGIYGTLGISAPGSVPGARSSTVVWTDATGDFWLFGGDGYDSAGNFGFLNDLWKYSAGTWTWMGGSNLADQPGTYGTQGTSSPSNIPPPRSGAVGWTDAVGNFWLFGGLGYSAAKYPLKLNDLWKYSAGAWTWMSGSSGSNQSGTYGIKGMSASSNAPGGRGYAVDWTDASGNLWLFGGVGIDSTGDFAPLNDLWNYNLSSGAWTWVSGSNMAVAGQYATYGTQGTAAAGNTPGGLAAAVGSVDPAGNFWLFGGEGRDSATVLIGYFNDLWKYDPNAGEWTWMRGSNAADQQGTYGTQGVAASGQTAGARYFAGSWIDPAGNFWLFGGVGYDSLGTFNGLNDLWEYQP